MVKLESILFLLNSFIKSWYVNWKIGVNFKMIQKMISEIDSIDKFSYKSLIKSSVEPESILKYFDLLKGMLILRMFRCRYQNC